ncbi:type-F conjugative transfer system mating-pair stabilization protein TraN [Vibrio sp. 10N.261.52.E5]|uniref:Type-F conjugative transfer system mating-pair stabilization protein TraN n=1 Tax=Vibrio cyclitrophicus TaxID=47951 RepID=A0A7Z1S0Y5_9VIBR|nr:type-F conjugative transfer system mating-pair stabilization protein TraN [Vibrio sp. 10N.261.52.E5]PMP22847.1 type-F conjugative transfer system mating-pair stabilization protein TraN [Vibrio cyclitrophicus]PMP24883.1 type-F conjugative transfer system mating-pair stabilization protein TraN [Vibrio cyclitrophicus]
MFIATHALSASQEHTFYEHVDWAKNAPNEAYAEMSIDLSDFCSDNNPDCDNQIRNPDEASMNDAQITDQSTTEYYNNEQAQAVQEGFNNNSAHIDPNDDTYRFATLGIDNAYEISHGLSNQYADCDSGTQCNIDYIPRSCLQPTYDLVPCFELPTATVALGTTHKKCLSGYTLNGLTCNKTSNVCRYNKNNKAIEISGWITYIWDGIEYSGYQFNTGDHGEFSLGERKYYTTEDDADDITEYEVCKTTQYSYPVTLHCDSGYTLSGGQCIKNIISWSTTCSLTSECKQTHRTCIEGPETRVINGVSTTLDCWKYQLDHQCDRPDTCASLPTDCTTTSSACSLMQNGICIEQEFNMSCPEQTCSATNLICGETSFCLDGDCFEEMATFDDSFDESASALAALAEAADGLGDPPVIFTGQGMQCTDKAFGFADCCKDSGWGASLGLDECNEEEKALGQAKEQGITISLGSYCASSVLGVCTRKKKTYCVFDSKLARIIQEQGSQGQLGISLGTAQSPICGAITPEQLQEIDFEILDFSDFYDDMHDGTNIPSAQEIQDRLQSAYEQ